MSLFYVQKCHNSRLLQKQSLPMKCLHATLIRFSILNNSGKVVWSEKKLSCYFLLGTSAAIETCVSAALAFFISGRIFFRLGKIN